MSLITRNLLIILPQKEHTFGFHNLNSHIRILLSERFWGTLAKILERMRIGIKNFDWAKSLPDVIENYNNTYHKSIKATPNEVWEGERKTILRGKL